MKAILLAAGKATRLGELSQETPKCLHRVGNQTLLDRLLLQLFAAGATEFLINTHHLAAQIETHISGSDFRERVTTVYEPESLGTLGTLRSNLSFFGGQPGWVLHADNFIEGSLYALGAAFASRPEWCDGVVLTFPVSDGRDFGVIESESNDHIISFHEKVDEPPTNQASAATYIFAPNVFSLIPGLPNGATDISQDLMPRIARSLLAVPHDGVVTDIGTPRGLELARQQASLRQHD